MKHAFKILFVCTVSSWTGSAAAQKLTIEDLARRVEALEQDNAALRAQLQQLTAPGSSAAAPPPPVEAATPAPVPAPISVSSATGTAAEPWDQAYVGIQAGYARFGSTYVEAPANSVARVIRQDTEGPSFGAQIGRRWQSGNVVTGLELQAGFPQVDSHPIFFPNIIPEPLFTLDLRASGRIKGAIGLTSGPWLGYATAGLDVSNLRLGRALFAFTGFTRTGPTFRKTGTLFEEHNYVGFNLGLGAAYSLGNGYSLDLELTRSFFGRDIFGTNSFSPRNDGLVLRLNQALP